MLLLFFRHMFVKFSLVESRIQDFGILNSSLLESGITPINDRNLASKVLEFNSYLLFLLFIFPFHSAPETLSSRMLCKGKTSNAVFHFSRNNKGVENLTFLWVRQRGGVGRPPHCVARPLNSNKIRIFWIFWNFGIGGCELHFCGPSFCSVF